MWPSGVSVSLMLSRWKVTLMKAGSEFAQGFDRGEDAAGAVAFERRQQFEREAGRLPCGGFADDIQYVHVQTLFGMIFSTVSTASPRRSA